MFANNLKYLRTRILRRTQKWLANVLNVSDTTIVNWESGEHTPPKRRQQEICNILNQQIPDLLVTPEILKSEDISVLIPPGTSLIIDCRDRDRRVSSRRDNSPNESWEHAEQSNTLSLFASDKRKLEDRRNLDRRSGLHLRPTPSSGGQQVTESDLIPRGLSDLIDDKKTTSLMNITAEEIDILKRIGVTDRFSPSKQFYIDALFDFRQNKDSS